MARYTHLGEGVVPGSLRKFNYKDKDGYVIYRFMVLEVPRKAKEGQKSALEEV